MSFLPCGVYNQSYTQDQKWWRTRFVKGKMILMVVLLLALPFLLDPASSWQWFQDVWAFLHGAKEGGFPQFPQSSWLTVVYNINYFILAALGVQLLIGYCGQITLGHAAFVAVGGYCSSMMVLFVPWPKFIVDLGLAYPISMVCAGLTAGLWSVLFGLPSARVKGFYLIMTTMAAQWITVPLVITQYVAKIGDRGCAFSIPEGTIKIGPWWSIDNDISRYYWSVILVVVCLLAMGNILRSKLGRAWIAIRDNDIAAETMGVNIVTYKLLAFFVAGFFAGIAGSFYISALFAVSPEHYEWYFSLLWVGIILIGGVGSIQGLVFGSIFVVLVFELLRISVGYVAQGGDWIAATAQSVAVNYPALGPYLGAVLERIAGFALALPIKLSFVKESAFGLAIILFLIYEPNGLSYRYWQLKNYFNLWPFSYTGK